MNSLLRICTLAAVLMLAQMVWSAPAQALSYGGHATGAEVTVPATGTIIRAATGTLSISGGGADAALLVGDIPGDLTGGVVALTAGTMHSAIVGLDATSAEASMANVSLTVSGNQITAEFLMARSTASCGPAVAGSSQLGTLVINGEAVTVTGDPNQTVTLPNGTVVINEQAPSIVGTSAELTVTALHVTTRDAVTGQELADAKLSTVDAKIDCQAGSPPSRDFTSGGGWIPVAPSKATFGVFGGTEDGGFRGHLAYHDHSANFTVTSNTITAFLPGCQSEIRGTGDTNLGPQTMFTIRLSDSGEPGTSDTFTITFDEFPQFNRTGTLGGGAGGGGNILAHRQGC